MDAKKYTIDPITGFLHLPIVFAEIGVLDYPENDKRRFTPPEILRAAADSANYGTIKLRPDEDVSVTNIKFDGEYLRGETIIQDQEF